MNGSDRLLMNSIKLHIMRAVQHVFSDRQRLRALLLRLSHSVCVPSVPLTPTLSSPPQKDEIQGDDTIVSTALSVRVDDSQSIEIKPVCITLPIHYTHYFHSVISGEV